MSFFEKKKETKERRRPDDVGKITETLGCAIWAMEDGDHELKIGEALSIRKKPLIVRSVVPLSALPQMIMALSVLAETFAEEKSVPESIRSELSYLAKRLEAARNVTFDTPEVNGVDGGFLSAA
jgi:hypothetical protein